MVIQILAGAAYSWVEHTWIVATWTAALILAVTAAKTYYESELDFSGYTENLLNYSKISVGVVSVLGAIAAFTGFQSSPPLLLANQLIALVYFGYLFWNF